jgi:hypothetical protein
MPFRFSQVQAAAQAPTASMITDLRNAPVRDRNTEFRLAQQNILAYTFDMGIPGWATPGLNTMPFTDVVGQALNNASQEGHLRFGSDFAVKSNAVAKVTGDIYEILTHATLWNAATRWNHYMQSGDWATNPRYARPATSRSPQRQIAVLNLPRRYDWVRLLVPEAQAQIASIRQDLASRGLSMPTSTPDIAVIVLPAESRESSVWSTPIGGLSLVNQKVLSTAHELVEGRVEAGEIILAMALKSSLRSDRLYQPLYEANVMQFFLEAHLGAPRVDFEVHALSAKGTSAETIYSAAALHSAASDTAHRAIRELYEPKNAREIVERFFAFLNRRLPAVGLPKQSQLDVLEALGADV